MKNLFKCLTLSLGLELIVCVNSNAQQTVIEASPSQTAAGKLGMPYVITPRRLITEINSSIGTNGMAVSNLTFAVGTLYTNQTGVNILLANLRAVVNLAAVDGNATLAFKNGNTTNILLNLPTTTVVTVPVANATNGLASIVVSNGLSYGFLNNSVGAGNSVTMAGSGQILTLSGGGLTTNTVHDIANAAAGPPSTNAAAQTVMTNTARAVASPLRFQNISPAQLNVAPVPRLYSLSGSFGTNYFSHYVLTNYIIRCAANNIHYFQLDAGWAFRDAAGNLELNDWAFTNRLKWYCDFGKTNGVDLGFFLAPFGTAGGWNVFGQAESGTNMVKDVFYLATNGVAGLKIDNDTDTNCIAFWNTVAATVQPLYRQISASTLPFFGSPYGIDPILANGVNSFYVAAHQPDTGNPVAFTNAYAHFLVEYQVKQLVKPGTYIEGAGWLTEALNNFEYSTPQHCYFDLALMLCENIMVQPTLGSYLATDRFATTNEDLLAILQDPLVLPAYAMYKTETNSLTLRQLFKAGDYTRVICFANNSDVTNTMTVTAAQLNFTVGDVFTVYSPWFHGIDAFATNSFTVAVPPTDTRLFVVERGFRPPWFNLGTNYLSDWPDASPFFEGGVSYGGDVNHANSAVGALGWDYRDQNPATPLIIGSTTYTKGFCAGSPLTYNFAPKWKIALGGVCSTFNADIGKQQAWNGGSTGGRITIWLDDVQAWQSGWITNNALAGTGATNVVLDVTGKNFITFQMETTPTNGVAQMVVGNATVTVNALNNSVIQRTHWKSLIGKERSVITGGTDNNQTVTENLNVGGTTSTKLLVVTNSASIPTNTAPMPMDIPDISQNGIKYTNTTLSTLFLSFTATNTINGNGSSKVCLYIDQNNDGTFETVSCSGWFVPTLAATLNFASHISGIINPGGAYYVTNITSGTTAFGGVLPGTTQRAYR